MKKLLAKWTENQDLTRQLIQSHRNFWMRNHEMHFSLEKLRFWRVSILLSKLLMNQRNFRFDLSRRTAALEYFRLWDCWCCTLSTTWPGSMDFFQDFGVFIRNFGRLFHCFSCLGVNLWFCRPKRQKSNRKTSFVVFWSDGNIQTLCG